MPGEHRGRAGSGRADDVDPRLPSATGAVGPATDDNPATPALTEAFWAVARELRHRSLAGLAPLEITPGQARALRVLDRHGEVRMSVLSEHLRIAPRSATEVADDLERRELVARRADPQDRRAVLVDLTGSGRRLVETMRTARNAQGEAFFDTLTDRERVELARILRRLLEQ